MLLSEPHPFAIKNKIIDLFVFGRHRRAAFEVTLPIPCRSGKRAKLASLTNAPGFLWITAEQPITLTVPGMAPTVQKRFTSPMTPTSKISVRSLEVRDFSFVRELSSSQPNFTIPPPYVLWLLTRISPELCLV